MSDKANKIIFRVTTGLLTVIILMYVANSIFNHEIFSERFAALGHPVYLIYPLTIAKILAMTTIWSNKSKTLKEWAYAGLFFVFILAMLAEMHAEDGEYVSSIMAVTLLLSSYIFGKKVYTKPSKKQEQVGIPVTNIT
ncbi:DoxX family protein [Fulvivirgaceae bacterium BMA12]|uniref:DoxX family protein n=1 Tax=Agaribacillus aureus TaxID=3051825 RepID=A0ABT8LBJ7_9BACT|nr:DoxX family protein [Fulvivirgaceae bacterium BMA12]